MNMPVDPDAFFDPARRSAPPRWPRRVAGNPFGHASQGALRLLLSLTFGRRALADLSRAAGCDPDAGATRAWTVAADLAAAARVDRVVARLVDDTLAERLARPARLYQGRSVSGLATLWARHRATLTGPRIAALLWVVLRSDAPCTRQLEAALVDDLTWHAARGLGTRK